MKKLKTVSCLKLSAVYLQTVLSLLIRWNTKSTAALQNSVSGSGILLVSKIYLSWKLTGL